MNTTQNGHLPRPTIWSYALDDTQFDKQLALLKEDGAVQRALGPLLAAAAPYFAECDDPEMALDGARETLIRMSFAVVVGAGPDRATYVENATQSMRKSWRQIETLPKSIRRIARTIREVHRGSFFIRLAEEYRDLPRFLEEYAATLAARTKFDYTTPGKYLLEIAKEWTGAEKAAALARLAQAVADALGLRAAYTPQSVRDWRRDRRQKRRKG